MCHRVQGDCGKAPTLLCVVVGVALVFVVVFHAHVQLRARLGALFKLSIVSILSHSYPSLRNFCGLWVFSPARLLVRDLIELFLFAACSVAILLVHVNANLFLSRKIDQFRMLSRLSLDITATVATGDTLYFVSAVL